jgi:hypothetical protein
VRRAEEVIAEGGRGQEYGKDVGVWSRDMYGDHVDSGTTSTFGIRPFL